MVARPLPLKMAPASSVQPLAERVALESVSVPFVVWIQEADQ